MECGGACPFRGRGRGGARAGLSDSRCGVCGTRARYAFAPAAPATKFRCLRHAVFFPRVRNRAAAVAVVVGTVLFAINQLDVVLAGTTTALVALKIALTYAVPYSVSTYSALEVSRLEPTTSR